MCKGTKMKSKMHRGVTLSLTAVLVTVLALQLVLSAGCTSASGEPSTGEESVASAETLSSTPQNDLSDAPEIPGLTCESVLQLDYAEGFAGYYYNDGFEVIDIFEDATILLVPEGAKAPEGIDEDMVVLQKPVDNIYLAATASMSLFDAMDGLDAIKFSSLQAEGWHIDNARIAMEEGSIVYAGKYREPDYELLIDSACELAIESTMIAHSPKVKEMLETLGIPVIVDQASYEPHPLGRTEWIKLYGMLVDKDDEAQTFFDEQAQVVAELEGFENTGLTVAYFYIGSNGQAVVRSPEDYIAKMIDIAGGVYSFADTTNPNVRSTTMTMTMEDFYATAVDADYLIYNSSIDQPLTSIDDLIAKDALFENFKAVQNGNVWCTGRSFYQASDTAPMMIRDINLMLIDGDASKMTFIYKLER